MILLGDFLNCRLLYRYENERFPSWTYALCMHDNRGFLRVAFEDMFDTYFIHHRHWMKVETE